MKRALVGTAAAACLALPGTAVANEPNRQREGVVVCYQGADRTVDWWLAKWLVRERKATWGNCNNNEPEVQEPEIQDPEINDPDPNDPEVQDPEIDDPETQDPEVQDPEVQDPEVQEPPIPGPAGTPGAPGLTTEQVQQLIKNAEYCQSRRAPTVKLVQRRRGSRVRNLRVTFEGKLMPLTEGTRTPGGRRQWTVKLAFTEKSIRRGIYVARVTAKVDGKTVVLKHFSRWCYGNPNSQAKESMNPSSRISL